MSSARLASRVGGLLFALSLPLPLVAQASAANAARGELPLKLAPRPTSPAISAADLMTRLYIFADDSMMGRQVGTGYNLKGTEYIAREVQRLGLQPAGDNGTYFQNIPLYAYTVDSATTLKLGGRTLVAGEDYLAISRAERKVKLDGLPVVYGGVASDSTTWLPASEAKGKIVVLSVEPTANPFRGTFVTANQRYGGAAALLVGALERVPDRVREYFAHFTSLRGDDTPVAGPPTVFIAPAIAASLFANATPATLKPGAAGSAVAGLIVTHEAQAPGRNVVALLPGSDPALRGQYVAIGAHNDHVGFNRQPVDHDSLRALNMVARPQGADDEAPGTLTAAQQARVNAMIDSLRKLHPARQDSIFNGADDDGSGSVSVLEIAEAFASAKQKPKRSILFVWHTGEEAGLYGSQHFTDHPTVPRDSIVAQLNMDMVGRGGANDVTGQTKDGTLTRGGPGYLQLVGSRRLSTELGDLIEQVNRDNKLGFRFDYSMDANGHPQNIYCRSDHYEYARYGIPIVFFTTGGHSDYHQVTDEPQYIDYDRMASVASLVYDAAWKVADLDHRVVVDKAKPNPKGACVQ
jgi:hypothetical protein